MSEIPDSLLDLLFWTLDQARENVIPSGGALTAFAMIETAAGERSLVSAPAGSAVGPAAARSAVTAASGDIVRSAVAWNGHITVEGVRDEAILVEGSERGRTVYTFAQRYRRRGFFTKVAYAYGNPALVGKADSVS